MTKKKKSLHLKLYRCLECGNQGYDDETQAFIKTFIKKVCRKNHPKIEPQIKEVVDTEGKYTVC